MEPNPSLIILYNQQYDQSPSAIPSNRRNARIVTSILCQRTRLLVTQHPTLNIQGSSHRFQGLPSTRRDLGATFQLLAFWKEATWAYSRVINWVTRTSVIGNRLSESSFCILILNERSHLVSDISQLKSCTWQSLHAKHLATY